MIQKTYQDMGINSEIKILPSLGSKYFHRVTLIVTLKLSHDESKFTLGIGIKIIIRLN